MLSLRNVNAVLVVDSQTWRVKSSATGPFLMQHDPDFLPNGNVLVFDNRITGPTPRIGRGRILEIDPATREVVWSYQGEDGEPFYTEQAGGQQLLPNGDVLVIDSPAAVSSKRRAVPGTGSSGIASTCQGDGLIGLISGAQHVNPGGCVPQRELRSSDAPRRAIRSFGRYAEARLTPMLFVPRSERWRRGDPVVAEAGEAAVLAAHSRLYPRATRLPGPRAIRSSRIPSGTTSRGSRTSRAQARAGRRRQRPRPLGRMAEELPVGQARHSGRSAVGTARAASSCSPRRRLGRRRTARACRSRPGP